MLQVPHSAVQCRQPAGLRSAVPRHQRVRQSPAAAQDQRRHQPLELAALPAGLTLNCSAESRCFCFCSTHVLLCLETRCAAVQRSSDHSLLHGPELHGLHLHLGHQVHPGKLTCKNRTSLDTHAVSFALPHGVRVALFSSGLFRTLWKLLPAQSYLLLLCLDHRPCSGRCGQGVRHHHFQTAAIRPEGKNRPAL